MVLVTARPKYKENTIWPGMRGRDAVRKSTPKVFTIIFSEIQVIVNHKSQSDGRNKSAKSGMNLRKKTIHRNSLQRKRRRYKRQWCLTLNKAGKNGPMKLRSDYRAAVLMKNRLHHESGEPIEPSQIPVTSGHVMRAVSTHSSARPRTPSPAHRSASLLCSRKVWVTQSAIRCR